MKEASNIDTKARRFSVYPKGRPSSLVRDVGAAESRKPPIQSLPSSELCRTPGKAEIRRIRESEPINQARSTRNIEGEYRHDILRYMHEMEQSTMPSSSSMGQQPEIRWHMRPFLVDFLVEAHLTFLLSPETIYLAVNIVDRYISRRVVPQKHYQLLGCAALWIASKFEDPVYRVPTIQDLSQNCGGNYTKGAFIQMEYHILETLEWVIGHPTAETWLRVACTESGSMEDTKTQHVARFLMEITLFHREFVKFVSSAIAAGALILARYICGKQRRSSDESEDALQVAALLDTHLASNSHDLSVILVDKYSYAHYSKASAHVIQFFLDGRRFVHLPAHGQQPGIVQD